MPSSDLLENELRRLFRLKARDRMTDHGDGPEPPVDSLESAVDAAVRELARRLAAGVPA